MVALILDNRFWINDIMEHSDSVTPSPSLEEICHVSEKPLRDTFPSIYHIFFFVLLMVVLFSEEGLCNAKVQYLAGAAERKLPQR